MSEDIAEEFEVGSCNVKIIRDDDAQSPADRDGDTDLFIVAKHSQFYVPAPGEKSVPEHAEELVKRYKKTHWMFQMEAYIHSGVVLAFSQQGDFPDRRWDVSQVGFVFAAKKQWRVAAKAKLAAQSKIDEWNRYNAGDAWGYVVELPEEVEVITYSGGPGGPHKHTHKTKEMSCWGFDDIDYCRQQARETAEHYDEKYKATKGKTEEVAA